MVRRTFVELSAEAIARFWSRVEVRGPNECWPWRGSLSKKGYGRFFIQRGVSPWPAHCVAWILKHGAIPADRMVLHECDNEPCCNDAHLHLGTHQQNMLEARIRGSMVGKHGPVHHNAKLTPEAALSIFNSSEPRKVLAARHGVAEYTIQDIWSGRAWNSVTGAPRRVRAPRYPNSLPLPARPEAAP